MCIVTPGTREANNGNWRTARRWAGFLAGPTTPIVQSDWTGEAVDLLIAIHARRSAGAIARLRSLRPGVPVVLVLSGTDLYRDLPGSPEARQSLASADRIVALQEDALRHVPPEYHDRCEVIYQSAPRLSPARKRRERLDCVVVGHLREEKDPRTLWEALSLIDAGLPIRVRHIGAALDPALGAQARETMARDARYRWSGALPHGLARCAIRNAHLLVHPSRMEGGANVIVEAVTAGTPVLASRVSGNLGMLGDGYPGYFAAGDAAGLARRLVELLDEPGRLVALRQACRARAPLFTPARERGALRRLVAGLLQHASR